MKQYESSFQKNNNLKNKKIIKKDKREVKTDGEGGAWRERG